MTEATTHTLDVPGAALAYDVRRYERSTEPPLLLIGYPMAAAGFASLAGHFADRTVVTYDPRGSERSTKAPGALATPEVIAEDLHTLISEIGGPVDLFASSGGAIDALALVGRYPGDVRILIAHEPPTYGLLPDAEAVAAASKGIHDSYQRGGFGPAMARFIELIGVRGEVPAGWAERPEPDPQMFGLPTEDDGKRDDPLFSTFVERSQFELDFDSLRSASTHIVIAAGEENEGEIANRSAYEVARRLGTEVVVFPSHHGGFLGGEYGYAGKPDEFAAKLREVLDEARASVPAAAGG